MPQRARTPGDGTTLPRRFAHATLTADGSEVLPAGIRMRAAGADDAGPRIRRAGQSVAPRTRTGGPSKPSLQGPQACRCAAMPGYHCSAGPRAATGSAWTRGISAPGAAFCHRRRALASPGGSAGMRAARGDVEPANAPAAQPGDQPVPGAEPLRPGHARAVGECGEGRERGREFQIGDPQVVLDRVEDPLLAGWQTRGVASLLLGDPGWRG